MVDEPPDELLPVREEITEAIKLAESSCESLDDLGTLYGLERMLFTCNRLIEMRAFDRERERRKSGVWL